MFGWEFVTDVGFAHDDPRAPATATTSRRRSIPGIHERQAGVSVPDRVRRRDRLDRRPRPPRRAPHWHVTFTVADRDAAAADVVRLGGTVLASDDTDWTRTALVRDPQGAQLTLSQFTPPSD